MGLRLLLNPLLDTRVPSATFYLSVACTAVFFGTGPGILAIVLGTLATAYFLSPPESSFVVEGLDNQLGLALFVLVSFILLVLTEMQRRAKLRAERAEAAERLQRQRSEVTLSSIGDGVIATDVNHSITFINQIAAGLTGWSREEALNQPIETVFDIRDEYTGATTPNPIERAIREGTVVGLANHTVLIGKDGRSLPIDDSGAPILDFSGKVVGAVLVFRDVSEARARNAELRNRDRVINLAHDAIIVTDAERRIRSWNTGAWETYGWSEEEARGRVLHELLGTRGSTSRETIDEALRKQIRWEGELIQTCKDGQEITCYSRQVLLYDENGTITDILTIDRDVTWRKRAEENLRRTAAEAEGGARTLQALMEHIPEGVTIADAPDARIRMMSRHGLKLLGKPLIELLERPAAEHPASWGIYRTDGKTLARPEELPLARAVTLGEVVTGEEWMIRRSDSDAVSVLCNAAPIRDSDGRVTGGLMAWRDISRRKKWEEKLRERAKLESLGVLAGGIAHDFNNLLTAVLGNASLLLEEIPEASPSWSLAHSITAAAERAAKLTQQMLAYSGRGHFVIEPVDLSQFILETTTLIRSSIAKNVELRLNLAEGLPFVEADTAQLQQLVMNLVVNAAEATAPEGGRVNIITKLQQVDPAYIATLRTLDEVKPGLYVVLEVEDTGCGMDRATLSRIFEPFFTTKFTGRGLGLAAVQGIVRGHKGAIKIASAPGKGTTFRVLFPASSAVARPEQKAFGERFQAEPAGAVLVVDDEEIIRSTASLALQRFGYQVVLATNGEEAVHLYGSMSGTISLIILDMTMPGPSTEETIRHLRAIRADVPILLSSGFSEMEALQRFGNQGLAGFLQKPYTLAKLSQKLGAAAGVSKSIPERGPESSHAT